MVLNASLNLAIFLLVIDSVIGLPERKPSASNSANFLADSTNPLLRPLLPPNKIGVDGREEKAQREDADGMDARMGKMSKTLNTTFGRLLADLPANDGHWCERMANGELDPLERLRLEQWTFNESRFLFTPQPDGDEMMARSFLLREENTKCARLRKLLPFHEQPLSEEERQFPLAYGLLVHKSAFQVMALMSAIYQPQNAYCLVVDEKADDEFLQQMQTMGDCLPNVFVMSVGKIFWCGFEIVRAVYGCLRMLAQLNHGWRYFQYLSGVDLPLKTNLEMVRIFKRLNGTINADVLPFEEYRIRLANESMKPPLTLWKSSLSALISRQAADAMVANEKVQKLYNWLQYTWCSDESLWATIAGNPKELQIPGGFDSASFYAKMRKEAIRKCNQSTSAEESLLPEEEEANQNPFAVANSPVDSDTAQQDEDPLWNAKRHWHPLTQSLEQNTICHGKFTSESCVFGIGDVPLLLRRPELVAHKLYLDFQPAAYFCVWKTVRERALDWRSQRKFQGRVYAELPTVRAARGEPVEKLRFFFDEPICHLSISG